MKLTIYPEQFKEFSNKGYNLDIIYLLKLVENNYDLNSLINENIKLEFLYNSLIRKGLINKDNEQLTLLGKDILDFLNKKPNVKFVKRKVESTDFENWYKIFPGTDTFTYKNKNFIGNRSLKKAKEDCKIKFNKIILENEYTAIQLINALEIEIFQKKEKSLSSGTNCLSFMQNSLTYLNQRSFEPFIELINKESIIQKTETGTDI